MELLRTQAVDVVVTDLNMPERGGLWLWHHAHVLRPELKGRFVLIASEPLPEPRTLSLFLQTERILLKPLALDVLWQEIGNVMKDVASPDATRRAAPPGPGARPPV